MSPPCPLGQLKYKNNMLIIKTGQHRPRETEQWERGNRGQKTKVSVSAAMADY